MTPNEKLAKVMELARKDARVAHMFATYDWLLKTVLEEESAADMVIAMAKEGEEKEDEQNY